MKRFLIYWKNNPLPAYVVFCLLFLLNKHSQLLMGAVSIQRELYKWIKARSIRLIHLIIPAAISISI